MEMEKETEQKRNRGKASRKEAGSRHKCTPTTRPCLWDLTTTTRKPRSWRSKMPINLDVAPIGPFVTSGVGEHRSEKMLTEDSGLLYFLKNKENGVNRDQPTPC